MALSGCPWWAQRTPVERGGSRLAGARTTLRTPLPTATRMTDTATVYRRIAGARPTRDAEPPIRHVAVVGGGTAGWMTSLLLAHSGYGRRLQVTVLESPHVGIIGVGEGSTPWLRGFFEELGIEEAEWMPACHRSEEHTSELQSHVNLVCRLLLEKKKQDESATAAVR